ncbi:MAG: tetratricopeptide repeat protein [Sphingomonas sp.]
MIPLLLALAAAATPPAADPVKRFAACAALVRADAAKAVAEAEAWRAGGGGMPARMCLGLAYVEQARFGPAAIAFEQAAREAEIQSDRRAAPLWVQAGNASLADGDAGKARGFLDRALAMSDLSSAQRGEAYLDRARAQVAAGNPEAARADLDQATALVPGDPMAWLLSATLARRQGDSTRAAKDVAEAARLAPNEAPILYEQGNIAALSGRMDEARAAWGRAAKADAASPAGRAAAMALAGKTSD